MPAFAGHDDLDAINRCLHRARGDTDDASLGLRRIVDGIDLVARKALKQAILHHRAGTRVAFFTGLKNQNGGAVKVTRLSQVAGSTHQHRGVAVVPAGVHQPRLARFPTELVVLRHWQRIHVGAQADHPLATAKFSQFATHDTHHARFTNMRVNFIHTA